MIIAVCLAVLGVMMLKHGFNRLSFFKGQRGVLDRPSAWELMERGADGIEKDKEYLESVMFPYRAEIVFGLVFLVGSLITVGFAVFGS
jgi:hypothetical protein